MNKAVFAGAIALAMMGPLLVSEKGFGPATASAQDVVVTEGKISRLRAALRLTGEQLQHWRPVEVALRGALREQRAEHGGWVHKVREQVSGYAGSAVAIQRAISAAGGTWSSCRFPWSGCSPSNSQRSSLHARSGNFTGVKQLNLLRQTTFKPEM